MRFGIRHCLSMLAALLAVSSLSSSSSSSICRADDDTKAATYLLRCGKGPGQINQVNIEIEVGGDLKLQENGKTGTAPMSVVGQVRYEEKLLEADPKLLTNRSSIRYYSSAQATLKINKDVLKPELRDERRLIAASVLAGQPTLFSPKGPLTGDELDLVELPGNSLFLDLLLPDKEVKIGESWKHPDNLIAALLGVDSIQENELASTLTDVKNDIAIIGLTGKAKGKIHGVATELELRAKYHFNLKDQQVSGFALAVRENREVGLIGPGLDVTARLKVERSPLSESTKLSDDALAGISLKAKPELTAVKFESLRGGFRLTHDRLWHPMNVEGATLVLRRMERSDIVAQCNVSSLAKLTAGKHDNLTDFQADVRTALGQNFETFQDASESTNPQGFVVLRAFARGKVQDIPIEWRYYLVGDSKTGRRMAFAFTLEESLIDRLGTADRDLLDQVELFEPTVSTAAKPDDKAAAQATK